MALSPALGTGLQSGAELRKGSCQLLLSQQARLTSQVQNLLQGLQGSCQHLRLWLLHTQSHSINMLLQYALTASWGVLLNEQDVPSMMRQ